MSRSITDILIKPNAFFADVIGEKEDFKLPIIILLAGGIIAAGYGYLIGGLTARMMSGAVPGIEIIVTLSSAIGALIGVFIFWLIWTGIIFLISAAFKGKGSFKRTLQVTGYGYLPQVFGSLISLIAAFEYIPRIVVPQMSAAMMQDPVVMQVTINSLMRDPAMLELTQITSVIAIVFLLWSANIWIFGVQHARGISTRDAALSVGIPVFIYIAYIVYTLGVM
nr:Yip1 family protein [uncultured Methanoregula sp.]